MATQQLDNAITDSKDIDTNKVLDKAKKMLVYYMAPGLMLDYAKKLHLLGDGDATDIKDKKNTTDKNNSILSKVRMKGKVGYENFKKCLQEANQKELVDLLECIESGKDFSGLRKQIHARQFNDMLIFVKFINGRTFTIQASPLDSIENVRDKIRDRYGIGDTLSLIYAGQQLECGRTLLDYNIREDSTLHFALRLIGGDPNMAAMQQRHATVQSPQVEGVSEQTTTESVVTGARQNCILTLDRTSGEINISNRRGVRYELDHYLLRECSSYLCHDCTLKRVHLISVTIGTATINITLSKETVIRLSEKGPKGTTEEIIRQLPDQAEFDNDDFEIERALKNEIGQHVILDRVCCELIDHHSTTLPILYAYPAYDESQQVTLVCLLNETFNLSSNKLGQFRHFPVQLAPFYPLSKESINAESVIDRNDMETCTNFKDNLQVLNEIVSEHVDSMMTKHSNLEAIKVSNAHSHKNKVDTRPCVVFFCRCKSYIPYGEVPFPKILKHPKQDIAFPTDVREGYYIPSTVRIANEYNKEIAMGCSIGTQDEALSATLGPFVEIKDTSEVCFLTVRHLFPPPKTAEELIGTKLVQPAVLDMTVSDGNQVAASSVTGPSTVCGEVMVAEINDHVDAALVKIEDERLPKQGHFISVSRRELEFAGFSENDLPKFEDGSTMDARIQKVNTYATDRVIKFGKRTGLTKGYLSLSCMAVRNNYGGTGCVTFQGQQYTHVIKDQLQVDSFAAQNVFFQEGDSGSSVFLVDKDNRLYCIGMAIGALSDSTCVVTPIQNILHVLGRKLNKTIEIKAFRQ